MHVDKEGFSSLAESLKKNNVAVELDFKGKLDGGVYVCVSVRGIC